MKKIIWIIFLLLCVVAGCSSDETSNTADEADSSTKHEQKNNKEIDKAEDDGDNDPVENSEPDETNKVNKETEPKYQVSDTWSIVPLNDHVNEKVVLLTIDDAPDHYALEMAKTMKTLNVNAIFFVNGHFLQTSEKKKILKQIHDMGFTIGNHTFSHAYLPDLSKEEQEEEIVRVNDMVEEIIGERPKFFRAPNGANTDYTKQIAKEEGMILMNWSYGYDWNKEYMSKDALTDIMLHTELLGNGSNLLMHDREWTAAALRDIVVGLREQGFEIVDPKLIKTME